MSADISVADCSDSVAIQDSNTGVAVDGQTVEMVAAGNCWCSDINVGIFAVDMNYSLSGFYSIIISVRATKIVRVCLQLLVVRAICVLRMELCVRTIHVFWRLLRIISILR